MQSLSPVESCKDVSEESSYFSSEHFDIKNMNIEFNMNIDIK